MNTVLYVFCLVSKVHKTVWSSEISITIISITNKNFYMEISTVKQTPSLLHSQL